MTVYIIFLDRTSNMDPKDTRVRMVCRTRPTADRVLADFQAASPERKYFIQAWEVEDTAPLSNSPTFPF